MPSSRASRKPIKLGSAAFRALESIWYDKLKKSGFVDIEKNGSHGSTFSNTGYEHSGGNGGARLFVAYEDSIAHEPAEHPLAAYWDAVQAAAHALPQDYPRREFIIQAAVSGQVAESGRRFHLTKHEAKETFRRFVKKKGLGRR